MGLRSALVLPLISCAFAAQNPVTVAEVVSTVRTSIANRDSDADLAKSLHKLKLSERLDYRALDGLESEGVGPKAMVELDRLRELSHDGRLPAPAVAPPFPQDPTPSIDDQRRIVHDTQLTALNYARSLPDFFCLETIHRFNDLRGPMDVFDTVEVKLTYFDGRETYRPLTVNGRPTVHPMEELGGAVSQGEFGSILASIFIGESKAVLQWNHWTKVRGRAAHVYTFRIAVENSTYRLQFRSHPRLGARTVIAGQRGYVYIDRETNQVLRIISEADSIPRDFELRQSSTVLDYDFIDVSGRRFLLPVRADVRMGTERFHTRNLVEFHDYRKFNGESTITFQ